MPRFVEIGLLDLGKKIFKCFTIYGHDGHLGHVTSIVLMNFHLLVFKSLHKNLVENGLVPGF